MRCHGYWLSDKIVVEIKGRELSQQFDKLFRRHSGAAEQAAEGAFGEFLVIGNREVGDVARLDQDHVASPLAGKSPTALEKGKRGPKHRA